MDLEFGLEFGLLEFAKLVKIAKERQMSLICRIKKRYQVIHIYKTEAEEKKNYGYQGIRGKDELGDLD